MKLLSLKAKNRNIRIQEIRMEKIISVNSKKLKKKKRKEASPIILERVNIHFTLPKALTLFWKRPRNKLIKITDKFRNYYARKSICINLDFSETEKMFVDGTLYLLAELDTLKSTNSDIKFKLKLSKDLIVNQVLKQTGILDLLNINSVHDKNR